MSWSGWPKLPIFSGHHCKWNVWKLRNQGFGKIEKVENTWESRGNFLRSMMHLVVGCHSDCAECSYVLSKISFCVGIHFRMFNIQFNVKHFCIFCFQKSLIDFGCVLHSVYSTVCNMKRGFFVTLLRQWVAVSMKPDQSERSEWTWVLVCLLFFVI